MTIVNKSNINNNLIKLIGFCDNPYCYILDNYSYETNLYEFIIQNNNNNNNNSNIFNNEFLFDNNNRNLIDILLQITNAMLYLETLNQIHKDLSLKNCQISITSDCSSSNGRRIEIKLCDLAKYMYKYRNDYCILLTNTQQSLRLRHTSWETICTVCIILLFYIKHFHYSFICG